MPKVPDAQPAASPQTVPPELAAFFTASPRLAVACSGGADSVYLLYAAKACGADVAAYYVNTPLQPAFEREDARRAAAEIGVPLVEIPLDVLAENEVAQNPADRCYHCKRLIFAAIAQRAAGDGYTLLADGSNASDDAADRPGMRALAELHVASPLRQAGVTKAQLREFSRRAGLFTWNKPAYACLATRIPTGTALARETLQRVEQAEAALAALGFSDLRVRVVDGAAKLQLPEAQLPLALEKRREILAALAGAFPDVLLDMKPR